MCCICNWSTSKPYWQPTWATSLTDPLPTQRTSGPTMPASGADMTPRTDQLLLEKIAGRLDYVRLAWGLSDSEMALAIGCTPQYWGNCKHAKRAMNFRHMIRLCERFGLTLDWLIAGKPHGLSSAAEDKLMGLHIRKVA